MAPKIIPPRQGGKQQIEMVPRSDSPYKYKALTLIEIPPPGQSLDGLQYYQLLPIFFSSLYSDIKMKLKLAVVFPGIIGSGKKNK